ncbi:MAG: hypothetical protein Q4G49_15610 [Paracoccus sp. (in: a-proteobacteria)]|nr:hypothetical protein [Paracoccus sp. (in: a-proteobacteria)]
MGRITDPTHAGAILANGNADLIRVARTILYHPSWPGHAAAALGGQVGGAPQYLRSAPYMSKDTLIQRGG